MKVYFRDSISYKSASNQKNIYSLNIAYTPVIKPNSYNNEDAYVGSTKTIFNGKSVHLGNVVVGESPQADLKLKEIFKNLGYDFSHKKEQHSGIVSAIYIQLFDEKTKNRKVHIKELNSKDILFIKMQRESLKSAAFSPSINKEILPKSIPSLKDAFNLFIKQEKQAEDLVIDRISIKNCGKISGKNLKFKEIDAEGHLSIIDTENQANRIVSKGTVIIDSSLENADKKTANYVSDAYADKYLAGYFIADKAVAGKGLSLNYKAYVKDAKAKETLCLADSASVNKAECGERFYMGDLSEVDTEVKANRILIEDKAIAGNIVICESNGKPGEVIINTDNLNDSIKGIIDFQGKKGTIYINQRENLDINKVKDIQNVEIKPLTRAEMDKKIKEFDSDNEITFVLGLGTPSPKRTEKYNAYLKSIGCPYIN